MFDSKTSVLTGDISSTMSGHSIWNAGGGKGKGGGHGGGAGIMAWQGFKSLACAKPPRHQAKTTFQRQNSPIWQQWDEKAGGEIAPKLLCLAVFAEKDDGDCLKPL